MDEMRLRDLNAEAAESMARSKESDKLDYFAGCALAGILASMPGPVEGKTYGWEDTCKDAYAGAAAMMKERNRRMEE